MENQVTGRERLPRLAMQVANVSLCALALGGGAPSSELAPDTPAPTNSHAHVTNADDKKVQPQRPASPQKEHVLPPLPELTAEQKERLGCALNEVTPALKRALVEAQAAGGQFMVHDCKRGKAEEERMLKEGKSQIQWPDSAHNVTDRSIGAMGVDIYPLDTAKSGDIKAYEKQARLVQKIAQKNGIDIDWGGDWKTLVDGPHLEIKGYREVREALSEQHKGAKQSPDELTLAVAKLQGNALPTGADRTPPSAPPSTPATPSSSRNEGRGHS